MPSRFHGQPHAGAEPAPRWRQGRAARPARPRGPPAASPSRPPRSGISASGQRSFGRVAGAALLAANRRRGVQCSSSKPSAASSRYFLPQRSPRDQPQQPLATDSCPQGPTAWPVGDTWPITSPFGSRSAARHAIPGATVPHVGIDVGTPLLTAFAPIAPGTVTVADRATGAIDVRHNNVYTSRYRHASHVLVVPGQSVDAWTIAGLTGEAGSGPHLHFELDSAGTQVNPARCLPPRQ
jgi:murein DD-endopeptidase MepM/ murein hydrolase activator NlpD